MYSTNSRDDLVPYIENLKISAFRKAQLIKNAVHGVTIGPNSTSHKQEEKESFTDSLQRFDQKQSSDTTKHILSGEIHEEILPIRQVVKEYEIERHRQVQKAIESHSKKFELFDAQQNVIRKQQWLLQQQKFIQNLQHQEREILGVLKKYDDNKSNDREKLMCYYKELEEKRQRTAAVLEHKKRQKELLSECLDNQQHFQTIYHEIMINLKNCQDEKLKMGLAHIWKQCKELNDLMTALVSKCKCITNVTEEEKKTANSILGRARELKIYVTELLSKSEHNRKQETEQRDLVSTEVVRSNNCKSTVSEVKVDYVSSGSSKDSSLEKYVSKSNFKWYSEIIDFHEKYTESFKDLLCDDKYKQFKFDCKKAVNLSVNAISAVNEQHLRDKYVKLSNLLLGQTVMIADFQIRATQHPKGIQFCTDLLAKKFVLQGDMMISSNPEAAFSFATIIISLWNEHPEFGKILLAHFFKECPYLVPFYIPRAVDQTDQDYYVSQGYKYIDGQIEKQDKFLKRMTGIMRLYFAIFISHPKKGQDTNPHDIKVAWTWFVSVLKLEPRLDITATMLHTFLDAVGFKMQITYRIQFFKLLKYLMEKYLQSLKKIDNGGPVTRLQCLIQEMHDNNYKFIIPTGVLSENFW